MTKSMFAAALIAAGLASAQQETRTLEYHSVQSFSSSGPGVPDVKFFGAVPDKFFFERSEMAFDAAVVKGAPYSADAVTETTQALSDGNRIHRTSKATLYRDSEGRTRREQNLGELGPLMASGEPVQTIVIHDSVAETSYMLNSHDKTAHKMPGKGIMAVRVAEKGAQLKQQAEQQFERSGHFEVRVGHAAPPSADAKADTKNVKRESLGTQMIEGVAADGTRTTITIPAGAIGNERPIEVVTETWYSNQLHTTMMSKTTDPRSGETVYSLKNVKLAEPAADLFTVPSDYTVQ
jgi:hypothetical protein